MQLIAYSGFILRLLYKISQGKDVETYIASNIPNRSHEPLR